MILSKKPTRIIQRGSFGFWGCEKEVFGQILETVEMRKVFYFQLYIDNIWILKTEIPFGFYNPNKGYFGKKKKQKTYKKQLG